ncbi:MAG: hypothetical protein RLZZ58_1788, partial [Pseudomonadota bacterium]
MSRNFPRTTAATAIFAIMLSACSGGGSHDDKDHGGKSKSGVASD